MASVPTSSTAADAAAAAGAGGTAVADAEAGKALLDTGEHTVEARDSLPPDTLPSRSERRREPRAADLREGRRGRPREGGG